MKGFIVAILCVLTVGVSYAAYRSGALRDVLPREYQPVYVPVQPDYQRAAFEARKRESAAEWSDRMYADLYRDSGVPEVDEALRAHRALRVLPDDAWPHEWLHRRARSRAILDGEADELPAVPERLVGASEQRQPRWAGERGWREWDEPKQRRESVPAGDAARRFVWGVDDGRL